MRHIQLRPTETASLCDVTFSRAEMCFWTNIYMQLYWSNDIELTAEAIICNYYN